MTEIELAKVGLDMYTKIFHGFGGWYFVSANLIFASVLFLSLKLSKK
jgi:hypothetical protein